MLYNDDDILRISPGELRKNYGVVMQNRYIFSDTIERNIALGDRVLNQGKLREAIRIANLGSFIESLPLGTKTKIGASGNNLSLADKSSGF